MYKGLSRVKSRSTKQADPITLDLLHRFRGALDLSTPLDATFWCLFVLAFFLLFRKSNLVPDSVSKFDPSKQLTRGNIVGKHNMLLVYVTWSKTIQFKQRQLVIPLVALLGSLLCPVSAYKHMIKLTQAGPQDPAFCTVKKVPITYPQFNQKLKKIVKGLGLNPTNFSTHSFRRGGTSFAFQAGVPRDLIKVMGDWKSEAFLRYLSMPLEHRAQMAVRVAHAITKH